MASDDALARWMTPGSRSRRVILGLALYVVTTGVFATVAGPDRLNQHTQFNHYALLADAWLHGRQDLPNGPPSYTGNNDFAQYVDPDTGARKTFISFPPFPAVARASVSQDSWMNSPCDGCSTAGFPVQQNSTHGMAQRTNASARSARERSAATSAFSAATNSWCLGNV